ncbi:hypothetical protein DFJ58DRAFT_725144 [Suillus subalutaceus]|uniref:uncharacterized protein n=1 Tax=Suillus subalutaceus TaxID=48586 RepID=UPI001B87E621|nr:uncharacterized protein DFJ58DRAFT_725144 [Suillus subalutaceus]KAG1863243.1 hypothetical protein DFJ58DRAFT_725144 [Suillus subalutaceus]
MAPFNSALLTFSPTPEPDVHPVFPAEETDTPVQEVPETEEKKVFHSWATLLQALDTQVKIIPGDNPELFEDRETWMHSWTAHLKIELEFNNAGEKTLEEGKRTYKAFLKDICKIKERAVVVPIPQTPDIMDIDLSGSGESEVEEKEVPICTIKALPSCAVKADKGKESMHSVPTDGIDEVESQVECLRAENQHLKSIICTIRQSRCSQQSCLITLSHQAYSMSTELVHLDEDLAFLD